MAKNNLIADAEPTAPVEKVTEDDFVEIFVKNSSRNDLPMYKSEQASGVDVYANLPAGEEVIVGPGEIVMIGTGLSTVVPDGFEIQVRPRSGLAFRHGITVLNAPGTINNKIYRTGVINNISNHFC